MCLNPMYDRRPVLYFNLLASLGSEKFSSVELNSVGNLLTDVLKFVQHMIIYDGSRPRQLIG